MKWSIDRTLKEIKSKQLLELVLVITLTLLCVVFVIAGIYKAIHIPYDNEFIVGRTEEEIVAKYGEFCQKTIDPENGKIVSAEYMIRDNTPEMIMSYDNSLWYVIIFKNGVAVEAYQRKGWLGG